MHTSQSISLPNDYVAVGIDVSKDSLSVCLVKRDETETLQTFGNTDTDIKRFIKDTLTGFASKIVMESTGRYHLRCALLLAESGFDVRVINPLMTKKYATASIRKVKSDPADSRLLAEMALRERHLPASFRPNLVSRRIRKKIALIGSLEHQLQQLKAILDDYDHTMTDLRADESKPVNAIRDLVKQLDKQRHQLEREVEQESGQTQERKSSSLLLTSVPGITAYTAAIVTTAFDPSVSETSKQWIAFAGLDVSVRQSGKWKGRSRLTKRGNAYVRKKLFSAAWGAVMNYESFKQYYEQLKSKGRNHVECLTIIARKLLRIMFSVVKNQTQFNPALLSISP